MNHVFILYSSRNGQTDKIAHYMCNRLVKQGVGVELKNLDSLDVDFEMDPQIDAILIGAPIYLRKFPDRLVSWIIQKKPALRGLRSGFFSVGLNAANVTAGAQLANRDVLRQFMLQTGWVPQYIASFAGALKYTRYNFFLKQLMKWISYINQGPIDTSRDYELTDWSEVDRFLQAFVSELENRNFSTGKLFSERQLGRSLAPLAIGGGK